MKPFVLFALLIIIFGCLNQTQQNVTANNTNSVPNKPIGSGNNQTDMENNGTSEDEEMVTQEINQTESENGTTVEEPDSKLDLLMLGRSVSQDWAGYMNLEWQEDESYYGEYQVNSIRFVHVDSPPEIVSSSTNALEEYDSKVVFFKLCFVDFSTEAGEGLDQNEEYVEQVYDEATKHGRTIIVGNALPQLSQYTTSGLRYNHQQYNEWLDDFAASHENMIILDLYGMLTDENGNLNAEYAAGPEDSHLNDLAYEKITPALMEKLEASK